MWSVYILLYLCLLSQLYGIHHVNLDLPLTASYQLPLCHPQCNSTFSIWVFLSFFLQYYLTLNLSLLLFITCNFTTFLFQLLNVLISYLLFPYFLIFIVSYFSCYFSKYSSNLTTLIFCYIPLSTVAQHFYLWKSLAAFQLPQELEYWNIII